MKRVLSKITYLVPEIALYVFMAVCVMMVHRKGGPYHFLYAMIPIFIANTAALAVSLWRRG